MSDELNQNQVEIPNLQSNKTDHFDCCNRSRYETVMINNFPEFTQASISLWEGFSNIIDWKLEVFSEIIQHFVVSDPYLNMLRKAIFFATSDNETLSTDHIARIHAMFEASIWLYPLRMCFSSSFEIQCNSVVGHNLSVFQSQKLFGSCAINSSEQKQIRHIRDMNAHLMRFRDNKFYFYDERTGKCKLEITANDIVSISTRLSECYSWYTNAIFNFFRFHHPAMAFLIILCLELSENNKENIRNWSELCNQICARNNYYQSTSKKITVDVDDLIESMAKISSNLSLFSKNMPTYISFLVRRLSSEPTNNKPYSNVVERLRRQDS